MPDKEDLSWLVLPNWLKWGMTGLAVTMFVGSILFAWYVVIISGVFVD